MITEWEEEGGTGSSNCGGNCSVCKCDCNGLCYQSLASSNKKRKTNKKEEDECILPCDSYEVSTAAPPLTTTNTSSTTTKDPTKTTNPPTIPVPAPPNATETTPAEPPPPPPRIDVPTDVVTPVEKNFSEKYNCPHVIRTNEIQQIGGEEFLTYLNRYRRDIGRHELTYDKQCALLAQHLASSISQNHDLIYTMPSLLDIYAYTFGFHAPNPYDDFGKPEKIPILNRVGDEGDPNVEWTATNSMNSHTKIMAGTQIGPADFFEELRLTYESIDDAGDLSSPLSNGFKRLGIGWYQDLENSQTIFTYVIAEGGVVDEWTDPTNTIRYPSQVDPRLLCNCVNNSIDRNMFESAAAVTFVSREKQKSSNGEEMEANYNLYALAAFISQWMDTYDAPPTQDILRRAIPFYGIDNSRDLNNDMVFIDAIVNLPRRSTLDWMFTERAYYKVPEIDPNAYASIWYNAMYNFDKIGFYTGNKYMVIVMVDEYTDISKIATQETFPIYKCGERDNLSAGMSMPPEIPNETRRVSCPEYKFDFQPDTCPTQRTYEYMKNASQQILNEANVYRNAYGLKPFAWNDNLAAAAQWHASYVYDNLITVQTTVQSNEQGEATGHPGQTHGETAEVRASNANYEGNVQQAVFIGPEGMLANPMNAYCAFKDSFVTVKDSGKFAMFVDENKPKTENNESFLGIGWKQNVVVFLAGGSTDLYESSQLYDVPDIGDVKMTLNKNTQEDGWFYLNGQTITGTGAQRDNAVQLYGSTTLPNYDQTQLVQTTDNTRSFLGETFGNNQITLTQQNLPKVHYTGKVLKARDQGCLAATGPFLGYNSSGDSSGSEGTPSQVYTIDFDLELNPSATQAPIDTRPEAIGIKYMVFLGSQINEETEEMPTIGDVKSSVNNAGTTPGWFKFGNNVSYDTHPVAYQNAYNLFDEGTYTAPGAGATLTLPPSDYTAFIHNPLAPKLGRPLGDDRITLEQSDLPKVSYGGYILSAGATECNFTTGVFSKVNSSGGGYGMGSTGIPYNGVRMDLNLNPEPQQTSINVMGKYISVIHLVYLGLEA